MTMGTPATATQPPAKNLTGETSSVQSTLSTWKRQLVTKEDYFHHHKILGILCLTSFLYRLSQVFDDMGFASHPEWTIPTLTIHWMLTASSFQFKIPSRRIRDGARIWPQYRWHAFIFTTRSILLLALYWYEQVRGLEPNYDINFAIAMLCIAAADYTTYAVGTEFRSNTVRELNGPAPLKFLSSAIQFNSTTGLIYGSRSYAIVFVPLFTIQMLPFIGTLRRKGVLKSDFLGASCYFLFLATGFGVQSVRYYREGGEQLHLFLRSVALLAAFLRLTPLLPSFCWPIQNKFVIWILMYMIMRHARPVISELDVVRMRMVFGALILSLVVSGYVKIKSGYYPDDVRAAKKMAAVKAE